MAKATIKDYIIKFSKEKPYFHIDEIKNYLVEKKINFKQDTLKNIFIFLKKKKIFILLVEGGTRLLII
jgi:hypothetical protein